ncbi:uncharacterized protein UV8b_07097 [Ustilaginoidea virens]|uniref:Uncharacterized protein n=1 Tax=Ustilaginoidea virens TaxID=1159556 RepID=A0A063C6E3_USTVR|nr:uncharacterized protein UV8b_07097 [Ustilaginoidea virens]QUC22856.1 hypothetical protein UV8b_07097 [Ustilaginoidea virens]GAO15344.1 hypothetical protein UVI_02010110 [Ustilaginoidea virens]
MLFSKLIASFALLASQVHALPNSATQVESASDSVLDSRTIPSVLRQHAAKAIKAFSDPRLTMFHSGLGASLAARMAKERNLQTVEMTIATAIQKDPNTYRDTLAKYCIPKANFCDIRGDEAEWIQVWDIICEEWSERPLERTRLLYPTVQKPSATSFYMRKEEPNLIRRHIEIDVEKVQVP